MRTIIFLKEPKNSINREARIDMMDYGSSFCEYFIHNMNMPYQGTLSEIWSEQKLKQKIKDGEVRCV